MTKERRDRPRRLNRNCELRLCRPEGQSCPNCGRVVYNDGQKSQPKQPLDI